jgi:hypothetical protein
MMGELEQGVLQAGPKASLDDKKKETYFPSDALISCPTHLIKNSLLRPRGLHNLPLPKTLAFSPP